MIRLFLVFLLVTFQSIGFATEIKSILTIQEQSTPLISPLNENKMNAPAISKVEWLKKYENTFAQQLCKQNSLIRNCFLIDENQCQDFSQTISAACFENLKKKLPDSMTDLDQAHYGKLLTICTYDLFDKLLAEKRVPHPECRELTKRMIKNNGKEK